MSSTDALPPDFQPSYGTCTTVTPYCPIQATIYGAYFNFPAMLFFSLLYAVLLTTHLFLGLRYRTYSFTAWVMVSALMEMLGHVARTAMHFDPWSMVLLSLQICTLLWGPTLTAAGVSIAFKHMVHYCGAQYCLLPPRLIPWVFVGTDVATVVIQGAGGIIASVSSGQGEHTSALGRAGEIIMIAGVCFQVANMIVCSVIMLLFMRQYRAAQQSAQTGDKTSQYEQDKAADARVQKRFTLFAWAASFAFGCVLVRCIYRVAEMAGGWANPIMRNEVTFIVLDSTMVALALVALAAVHPGIFFPTLRKGKFPSLRKGKRGQVQQEDSELAQDTERKGGESSTGEGEVVEGR